VTLLGRLIGTEPPKLADGAFAYVDGAGPLRQQFCIRVRTGPSLSAADPTIGPPFTKLEKAQAYADWCNGEGDFSYGTGAA
jgi:hypothetical protein